MKGARENGGIGLGDGPWESLWDHLDKAVEQLQRQERFGLTELLASQPGMATWLNQATPSKCWGALNALRLRHENLPWRTKALAQAVMMLLLDYGLSAAGGQGMPDLAWSEVWSPVGLADRLRHHYLLANWGSPERAAEKTQPGSGSAPSDYEAQDSVARRWESELLPHALGIVLGEGRVVLPYETWQDLARQRVRQVLGTANLSEAGRDLVERLCQVLPEVVGKMHERFQGIFQEVEPSRWEHLKPDPGEVAMIIRARLYSLGPSGQCLGGKWAGARDGSGPPGREVRDFLKALRALAAKGMHEQVARALESLDRELESCRGEDLLSAGRALGADAKVRERLKEVLAGLELEARPSEAGWTTDPRDLSDAELLAKAEELLRGELGSGQVTAVPEMLEDLRRLSQETGLTDKTKSLLARVVADLEARKGAVTT